MGSRRFTLYVIDTARRREQRIRVKRHAEGFQITRYAVLASLWDAAHPPHADSRGAHAEPARRPRRAAKYCDQVVNGFYDLAHGSNVSQNVRIFKRGLREYTTGPHHTTIPSQFERLENEGKMPPTALEQRHLTGLRLVAARRALGRSQAQICRNINVASNTWNQWERGKRQPDPTVIAEFADIYGIFTDWVWRGRLDGMNPTLQERVAVEFEKLLASERLPSRPANETKSAK